MLALPLEEGTMNIDARLVGPLIAVLCVIALVLLWLYRQDPFANLEKEDAALLPAVMALPPALAPEPVPAPAPEPVALFFEFDRAVLGAAEIARLDAALDRLSAKGLVLEAVGHADRIGGEAYNLRLSERRAQAVKDYLVKKALDPAAVRTRAQGEGEPASGAACARLGRESARNAVLVKCLQPDRRVELRVAGQP
jgi:OOP family OmpA-OmpF porin